MKRDPPTYIIHPPSRQPADIWKASPSANAKLEGKRSNGVPERPVNGVLLIELSGGGDEWRR